MHRCSNFGYLYICVGEVTLGTYTCLGAVTLGTYTCVGVKKVSLNDRSRPLQFECSLGVYLYVLAFIFRIIQNFPLVEAR